MLVVRIEHHADTDRKLSEKIGASGRIDVAISEVRGEPLRRGEHERPPATADDVDCLDPGASRSSPEDRRPSEHRIELVKTAPTSHHVLRAQGHNGVTFCCRTSPIHGYECTACCKQ